MVDNCVDDGVIKVTGSLYPRGDFVVCLCSLEVEDAHQNGFQ